LIVGPYAHEFYDLQIDNQSLSNKFFYGLIFPDGRFPPHSLYTDVRDLAKAHVNALDAPPTSAIGRKRVLFSSPHELDYKDALKMIGEKRPQLRDRLNKGEPAPSPLKRTPCDFKRIEEVTGFKTENFHTVEQVGL